MLLPLLARAISLPVGKGHDEVVWNGKTVPVWTYRPAAAPDDAAVLFVCHGANRDADNYRDSWITQAEAHACVIVAPEFTDAAFPGSSGYNLGNMTTSGGAARPPDEWTFGVIEAVFDAVRAALGPNARDSYFLYGHSAGAQFVHRMLLFAPQARVARAVSANAGWYTVPELNTPFPYGLGGSAYSLTTLRTRLAQPHVVLLGTADIDPNDPELNHSAGADAQGATRLARGEYFYAHAATAAPGLGAQFGWKLGYAPGVAHSTSGMTPYAAAWLFSEAPDLPPADPAQEPDSPEITVTHLGYEATFNHGYTASASPTGLPWTDDGTVPGWFLYQNAAGTPISVTTQASLSSTSAGPFYLISHVDVPGNFVLGARVTDANGGVSGAANSGYYLALRLVNRTGGTITQFALGYTGVQFYRSLGSNSSTIEVGYQIASPGAIESSVMDGWTNLPALSFTSPQNGDGQSAASTVNFNRDGNFTDFAPAVVSGIAWGDGQELWIRWRIPNVPGTDQGVGLDNVSFAATAPAVPPAVISSPASTSVAAGANVTLEVQATGTLPLSYQWTRDGAPLAGETRTSLALNNVAWGDSGSYVVIVTNAFGVVASAPAVIAVAGPPTILEAPADKAVLVGQTLTLNVNASGAGPLTFQWQRNGQPIAGATTAAFVLPQVSITDAGAYTVVVTNSAGSTVSAAGTVTVGTSAIANLSIRAPAGAAERTLIAGFVVSGANRRVLVQSPTLAQFGVQDALADPKLAVYQGGTVVAQNDDWGTATNQAEIATAVAQLGAMELTAGGPDAAVFIELPAGVYTAQVATNGAAAGVGLAAVFAAGGDGRLDNVSGRCFVGTGDAIVIGGFVITGDMPKPMLVRAIGPALSDYGVEGVLLDPQLEVFSGGTVIEANDDWSAESGAAEEVAATAARLGAFVLETGSKDAALLLTLPPGAYTVQMSGVNGQTGVGLLEIYDAQ